MTQRRRTYADLAAELERKQQEIDAARELLRSYGANTFGPLADGITLVLDAARQMVADAERKRATFKLPDACAVTMTHDDLRAMNARLGAACARMSCDQAYRIQMAMQVETQNTALQLLGVATQTNPHTLLQSVNVQLHQALSEIIIAQRGQDNE